MQDLIDSIKWTEDGLVPVIAQDVRSGKVLMFAWMNRQSLRQSIEQGRAIYWSRSRGKLWAKGEESGHIQHIKQIYLDCDGDVILIEVEQVGGIACHTGRTSCFFRRLDEQNRWQIIDQPQKDPEQIYGKT